ncbi:hypothetical protein LBMAG53_06160 [Planctomycetota bacterium]|nr:hypothetical protein LBMAG53_06160 [Planctomycetota bacterium]
MPACALKPSDKRAQIIAVGKDLVEHHGKKNFYTIDEVKAANHRLKIIDDYVCWSHAFFNSRLDFDLYHAAKGELCDYFSMKSELAQSISPTDADQSSFNFDLSWLELPNIDWSTLNIFDISP